MNIEHKLEECYCHIKPYISKKETPLLIQMCQRCEMWCGKNHDYSECRNNPCFKLFLGYEYLIWSSSYEGD